MLSAPTTRRAVVDHQQRVDLVRFHQLRGFDRERIGADRLRRRASSPRRSGSRAGRSRRRRACGAGRRRCTGRAACRRHRPPRSCPGACGSSRPALRSASRRRCTRGTSSPPCMTSVMCSSRRRPSAPAGCERAKSSAVKPRASSSATASASPIASAAVVLAVGARSSGQASAGTLTSRCTSASRASVDCGRPVIAISGIALALEHRQQHQQLVGLAGVGQRQHHVGVGDHAQVAVAGFARMHVERRGAGGGQGRGDLARDMAGLAHAGADHAAVAGQQQPAGIGERAVDARGDRGQALGLDLDDAAAAGGEVEAGGWQACLRDWSPSARAGIR